MVPHNSKVIESLNRYISEGPDPHYAIMLNGTWGCGKTYFIKEKWINNIADKKKFSIINVSLFGLKTVDELKEEISHNKIIFEEAIERSDKADTVLEKGKELAESNVAKGIGSLACKILESKIGIDFNDITKIFTRDWLSEDKDGITKVLILDDLERSKMDLKEIFGLVSSYIEDTGLRVIFISNDDEIAENEKIKIEENTKVDEVVYDEVKGDENIKKYYENKHPLKVEKIKINKKTIETQKATISDQDYRRIREKVIGETLRIEADVDEALFIFFKEMKYSNAEKELIEPLIREVRLVLGCNNLRIIRQTLIKLQLLLKTVIATESYQHYPHEHIEINGKAEVKEEYIKSVAKFFILTNMKKIMRGLKPEDPWLLWGGSISYKPLTQVDEEHSIWVNYIWCGSLDEEAVKKAVQQDMEILVPQDIVNQDSIYKLQVGYWDFSRDEFYGLQLKMINELKAGFYTEIRAIMQAYCLLITFEKYGILEGINNIDDFFNEVLKNITVTNESGNGAGYGRTDNIGIIGGGYRGYQFYYSVDRPRAVEFLGKVKNEYQKAYKNSIANKMDALVANIIDGKKEANHFYDSLELNQPVLVWIGVENLWKILDSMSLMEQRMFFGELESRYGLNSIGAEASFLVYKPEMLVLERLVEGYSQRLNKAKEDRDNKVEIYSYLKSDAEKTLEAFKKKMEMGEVVNN